MVWVRRDKSNNILGVFRKQQPGIADEQISETDPAVVTFLTKAPVTRPIVAKPTGADADIAAIRTKLSELIQALQDLGILRENS